MGYFSEVMKKIFLNGYFGFKNFGDDILHKQVLKLLETYHNTNKICYLSPRYNLLKLLTIIRKGDVVINIGGIFQDKTGCLSFFYYFLINLIFILRQGKIISLSIDIADLRCMLNFFLFKYLIKHSEITVFRDKQSYLKFTTNKNVFYTCDIGFLFSIKRCRGRKNSNTVIVLKPCKNIKYLISILNKLDDKIFIIMPEDFPALKKYLGNNVWIYNGDINYLAKIIQNSKLLISMRYHPAVIALKYMIPVILISNENKIKNFASEYNLLFFNPDEKKLIDKLKIKSYIKVSVSQPEIRKCIEEWKRIKEKIGDILN